MLYPQQNQYRDLSVLDGVWEFRLDPDDVGLNSKWSEGFIEFRPIAVPSSWNELFPDTYDYIGVGWYQTMFSIPGSWDLGDLRLRFGSVTYKATVWINGHLLGSHEGGNLPFEFRLAENVNLDSVNRLVVRVENELKPERVPPGNVKSGSLSMFMSNIPATNYDFFPYSGIHRSVILYRVPVSNISDVTVRTSLKDEIGIVDILVLCDDPDIELSVSLRSGSFHMQGVAASIGGRLKVCLEVKEPRLWSPSDPHLYQLEMSLKHQDGPVDSYSLEIGICTIEIRGHEILLNGKPIELKGFGRHEDSSVTGRGQNLPLTIKDHNLMKWVGANSYRTSHYPYFEEDLFLADKHGFLVVDETPAVGLFFEGDGGQIEDRLAKCREQISELISRDKNHPSVIMWSVANEPFPPNLMNRIRSQSEEPVEPVATEFLATLTGDAKSLDDTRPVSFAAVHGTPIEWLKNVDVVMLNRYTGWYFDQMNLDEAINNLSSELDKIYGATGKPIVISEFGADTISGLHSAPEELYSEEYQVELLRRYLELAESRVFLAGLHVWVLADFRTSHSMMRIGGLNRKGVFTRDRQPKMAAHFLRSKWLACLKLAANEKASC